MSTTILPADTYVVVNKTIINDSDKKLVTMLYQPIIGYTAVSLYFTLLDDLLKAEIMSDELTHHHLMSTMQLKLEDIVIAREKLEAVGLIKTYFKKEHVNNYVYVIYGPLSANEFLNHPVLNVVLYNNLGKKEYDKIVNCFKIPKVSLKDYEDITKTFNKVFTSVSGNVFVENNNIIESKKGNIKFTNTIDFNMLASSIPKSMINEKCFNEEVKNLKANNQYRAWDYYNNDLKIRRAIDSLTNGTFSSNPEEFKIIHDELMNKNDEYFLLADFESYANAQRHVVELYQDRSNWAKICLVNIAKSGFFSSDRTIEQYVEDIWHLEKCKF